MPLEQELLPVVGRVRTVFETLAEILAPICELDAVKFVFIPPDSDPAVSKGLYLEMIPSKLDVESLLSTQRSFSPLGIDIVGLIRHADPLVGIDFYEEVITTLLTSDAVDTCNNAFGAEGNGFSIEVITDGDVTPATYKAGTAPYSQIRLKLNITLQMDRAQ